MSLSKVIDYGLSELGPHGRWSVNRFHGLSGVAFTELSRGDYRPILLLLSLRSPGRGILLRAGTD